MRIFLAVLLLSLTVNAAAPDIRTMVIIKPEPMDIYERLMQAILEVESGGDTLAYNPEEEACGPFQIRPIRLTDYNIRTGKKYKMRDCYTMRVSQEVFLYYARIIGPNYETIAKRWNGSGEKTIIYWSKVNAVLMKQDKGNTAIKPVS